MTEWRIDDLAREAGVATTTVRLYQSKGLLPSPRLVGRTGWYGPQHLARLRLIARLQEDGFSLAGIGRLLEEWERGTSLDGIVGVESQLDALLSDQHAVVMDANELLDRFPSDSMTPDLIQRAAALDLVQLTDDGRFRVPDRRFIDSGAILAQLGVPLDEILDEWEALLVHTNDMAERFINIFERRLLPEDWREGLDEAKATETARVLGHLRLIAHDVIRAALDASLARAGRQRVGDLLPDSQG